MANVELLKKALEECPEEIGIDYLMIYYGGKCCAVGHLLKTAGVDRRFLLRNSTALRAWDNEQRRYDTPVFNGKPYVSARELAADMYGIPITVITQLMNNNDVRRDGNERAEKLKEWIRTMIAIAEGRLEYA